MNVHSTDLSVRPRIPVTRILETRGSFPRCTLSFEVEFEVEELDAVSDLVLLFKRAGLTCDGLRYRRNGCVLARLRDSEASDFRLMDTVLNRSTSLRLVRWTSILSKSST